MIHKLQIEPSLRFKHPINFTLDLSYQCHYITAITQQLSRPKQWLNAVHSKYINKNEF
jgi:hypothetical protein